MFIYLFLTSMPYHCKLGYQKVFYVYVDIVRQRTKDADVKKYCVQHMVKLGAFEYTKKVLLELESQ